MAAGLWTMRRKARVHNASGCHCGDNKTRAKSPTDQNRRLKVLAPLDGVLSELRCENEKENEQPILTMHYLYLRERLINASMN